MEQDVKVETLYCPHCFKRTPANQALCTNNGCGRPVRPITGQHKEVINFYAKAKPLNFCPTA